MMIEEYGNAFRWILCRFFDHLPLWKKVKCDVLPPHGTRTVLPLVGAMTGFLIWCIVDLLRSATGTLPAVFAAGLLIPLALEFLTGWRGTRTITAFSELLRRGTPAEEALSADWSAIPSRGEIQEQVIPVVFYLLRCGLYAALAADRAGVWFLFAWTGSFFVRSELTTLPVTETGKPYLPDPGNEYGKLLTAGVFLIAGIGAWSLFQAIAAAAASWLIAVWFVKVQKACGGWIDAPRLALYGAGSEILLLFLGTILS